METLYLECNMGAAGDMLMAALYELCTPAQQAEFLRAMHGAGLEGLTLTPQDAVRCGVCGTQMRVSFHGVEEQPGAVSQREAQGAAHSHGDSHAHGDHDAHMHHHAGAHETAHLHSHAHTHCHAAAQDTAHSHGHSHDHAHGSLHALQACAEALHLPQCVKRDVLAVYESIANAESAVHGVPVQDIHFHEVGTLDALADVAGVCLLVSLLAPGQILASPVATGSGMVRCAHGLLPVPAPATALLLEGLPTVAGPVQAELCTPTGAALLRHFAVRFGLRPAMTVERTGYGMGSKDFAAANCVRAFWGRQSAQTPAPEADVTELACNLDDMSPEALAYAAEQLLGAGALDVYTQAIGMKKGRAATKLSVLCLAAQEAELAQAMLLHTTTLGVRAVPCRRYTLPRTAARVHTPYGEIAVKVAQTALGARVKPEYDDVARAARQAGVPFAAVFDAAVQAWHTAQTAQSASL